MGACGGTSALGRMHKAVATTRARKRATIFVSIGATTGGTAYSASGRATADFSAGRMKLSLPLLSSFLPDQPTDRSLDVITDGSTLYFRLTRDGVPAVRGRPWVEVDAAALPPGIGPDVKRLVQLQQADFTEIIDLLGGSAGPVKAHDGGDAVAVPSTAYSATVNAATADRAASGPHPDAVRRVLRILDGGSSPIMAWLDRHGSVEKLVLTIHETGPPTPAGPPAPVAEQTIAVDVLTFGGGSKVELPPVDQTQTAISALDRALGSAPRRSSG